MIVVSQSSLFNDPSRITPTVTLSAGSSVLQQAVLVDSGADASLMEAQLVERLGISRIQPPSAVEATALDRRRLWKLTHCTDPVTMTFADSHSETIHFHIVETSYHPVVLGHTWLRLHNPRVDWGSGEITEWGSDCVKLFSC